ncbi:MAG TPA: metalloregulator ArsR/SmtB family transcription factor [Rubellimicrobium sp.]|jgi:DNA-binding transcriptional ArsR family regulator|nr:metalloregulator ArsR/SmtB family transcription factor [Rubellimicrobium sp.]
MDDSLLIGDFARVPGSAADAARFLSLLANEKRLLLLCHLQATGECDVTSLAAAVGLSASALSQHLARLRAENLVAFRRESQTIYYRLEDARAVEVMRVLKGMFC